MKLSFHRSWLILGVALAIGGVAAYGVNRYLKHQVDALQARSVGHTVRVVVPKADLAKGSVLTPGLVAVREVPAEWAHSNAITPDEFDKVEGQKLAYPVNEGEAILWSLLEGQRAATFSARLARGHRAVTVQVDELNSISGMVEPGDRIDLIVSMRKDDRQYLVSLLQNVTVLATGARATTSAADGEGHEARHTYTTVTLDATPEQAQRVLAARELGKLAALLRAPGDDAVAVADRRDVMALLGLGGVGARQESSGVPVMYGGRAGGSLKDAPALHALTPTTDNDTATADGPADRPSTHPAPVPLPLPALPPVPRLPAGIEAAAVIHALSLPPSTETH